MLTEQGLMQCSLARSPVQPTEDNYY